MQDDAHRPSGRAGYLCCVGAFGTPTATRLATAGLACAGTSESAVVSGYKLIVVRVRLAKVKA